MAQYGSAIFVIIGVTLLGVWATADHWADRISATFLFFVYLIIGVPVLLVCRAKSRAKKGRVIVECQWCGVRMTYARFREGTPRNKYDFNHGPRRCPNCLTSTPPVSPGEGGKGLVMVTCQGCGRRSTRLDFYRKHITRGWGCAACHTDLEPVEDT